MALFSMPGSRLATLTIVTALLMYPAFSGSARSPLVDETRGVLTLAPMLERVTPAVVNIAVVMRSAADRNPLLNDPFFRKFFGLPETGTAPNPVPQERRALAAGSGVIIDAAKGLIVTNHHMIKDAETLKPSR